MLRFLKCHYIEHLSHILFAAPVINRFTRRASGKTQPLGCFLFLWSCQHSFHVSVYDENVYESL